MILVNLVVRPICVKCWIDLIFGYLEVCFLLRTNLLFLVNLTKIQNRVLVYKNSCRSVQNRVIEDLINLWLVISNGRGNGGLHPPIKAMKPTKAEASCMDEYMIPWPYEAMKPTKAKAPWMDEYIIPRPNEGHETQGKRGTLDGQATNTR